MDNFNGYTSYDSQSDAQDRVQDITVKTFMYMFFALMVSGFFAFVTYATGNAEEMISNGTIVILIVVELISVIVTTILVRKNLPAAAAVCGTIYCIVNGLTLSVIFLVYEMQSIVAIFLYQLYVQIFCSRYSLSFVCVEHSAVLENQDWL